MNSRHEYSGSLGYLTTTVARGISHAVTSAFQKAGFSITFEQWAILVSLWNQDGQCQHELAICQGKDRPTITRLIDNLQKNNFVVRVPSEVDKRVKKVFLTYGSRQNKAAIMEVFNQVMQQAIKTVDADELENCLRVLSQIQSNLTPNVK